MLIIWGSKTRTFHEGSINHQCVICQYTELNICSSREWFTFFFIPIFPISSKKYYMACEHCENCYKFKEELDVKEMLNEEAEIESKDFFTN